MGVKGLKKYKKANETLLGSIFSASGGRGNLTGPYICSVFIHSFKMGFLKVLKIKQLNHRLKKQIVFVGVT